MKINNKGMTLIEIMASIALLSIVMLFLFNILSDLKMEDSLSSKRTSDVLKRAQIIKLVENDIISIGLNSIENAICLNDYAGRNACLVLTFKNGVAKTLSTYTNGTTTNLVYGTGGGNSEIWNFESGTFSSSSADNSLYCLYDGNNYYARIVLPLLGGGSAYKSDIEITAYGKNSGFYCNSLNNNNMYFKYTTIS